MVKITADEILKLGFGPEMFGVEDAGFLELVDARITEQAELLEGRIGPSAYAATAKPMATYVKRAEKSMVAAEMVRIRINHLMGNVVHGDEKLDTRALERQEARYRQEAESFIAKIVAGVASDSNDFSSAVLIS